MTPDAPDAPDNTTVSIAHNGQISPGCLTAGAILDGPGRLGRPWSPPPTLPQRNDSHPVNPPAQTQSPWTSPQPGSFILFELDKRALASRLSVPEGSDLLKQCLAFPTKRYVGFVVDSSNKEDDSNTGEYVIAFVTKSLSSGSGPRPDRDAFTMRIAATKAESADDRRALCPRPFPWTGCHQYTVFGTMVVPTHVYPSEIEYGLDKEDRDKFEASAINDWGRLGRQRHRASSAPSKKEAFPFEDMRVFGNPTQLPVKIWQDLAAESECHDPREFAEEVLNFKEISKTGSSSERFKRLFEHSKSLLKTCLFR
jgi:hypothetical protein